MDGCGERGGGVLGKGAANRSRNKSGVVAPLSGAWGHVKPGVGEIEAAKPWVWLLKQRGGVSVPNGL